jgi:hypothetical protein
MSCRLWHEQCCVVFSYQKSLCSRSHVDQRVDLNLLFFFFFFFLFSKLKIQKTLEILGQEQIYEEKKDNNI